MAKPLVGVAKVAKIRNIPVIAIAGSIADNSDGVYDAGIDAMIDIVPEPMALETAIENATTLIETAAERAGCMVATGMKIERH